MNKQIVLTKPDFDSAVKLCLEEISSYERQWVSVEFSSLIVVNPSAASVLPRYVYCFKILEQE